MSVNEALKNKGYKRLTVEMFFAFDKWGCLVRGEQPSNTTANAAYPHILHECRHVLCSGFSTVHALGFYVIDGCPFGIKLTEFNVCTYVFDDDS